MNLREHKYIKVIGFVLVVVLAFTIFGVYNSDGAHFLGRLILWAVTISVGTAISLYVTPRVLSGPLRNAHSSIQICVIALIMSVPITVIVIVVKANGGSNFPSLFAVGRQFLLVFFVSLVLTTVGLQYWKIWFGHTLQNLELQDIERSIRSRMSAKFRKAELIAVSAEDHYVRVHTSIGNELILMRFSDALLELSGEEGMRVHRSWWVSRHSVEGKRRENRRLILELSSGIEAPVARSSRTDVLNWAFP